MALAKVLVPIIDLVFPPRCPLCGEGLAAQAGVCAECWRLLVLPGAPSCRLCQRPFPDHVAAGAVSAPCLADPPHHDGIAAATLYNPASRRLVLALKYGGRPGLAGMMARLMSARLPQGVGPGWLVVPVPLHRWRLWRRGYNQAALLARAIARERRAELLVDGLVRRKATPSLGGLGRKARVRALAGAIAVQTGREARISGADIVLVDDVLTSGATSSACVTALKRAGARRVVIACFARVLDEALP